MKLFSRYIITGDISLNVILACCFVNKSLPLGETRDWLSWKLRLSIACTCVLGVHKNFLWLRYLLTILAIESSVGLQPHQFGAPVDFDLKVGPRLEPNSNSAKNIKNIKPCNFFRVWYFRVWIILKSILLYLITSIFWRFSKFERFSILKPDK